MWTSLKQNVDSLAFIHIFSLHGEKVASIERLSTQGPYACPQPKNLFSGEKLPVANFWIWGAKKQGVEASL